MIRATDNSPKKVVIIGGGLSGLATAALLGMQGWHVTVLEKNAELGGRAKVLKTQGFTFDMGPSWYMMPEVFDRFFAQFGKKTSDFYSLLRLDPRYTVYFEDTETCRVDDDVEKNIATFERIEPGAGKKLRMFLQQKQQLYHVIASHLLYIDIWNVRDWFRWKTIRSLFVLLRHTYLFRSWHDHVKHSFRDERLQKMLSFPAVFLGGSPFNTPALYSILCAAEFIHGVWYPKGGIGMVIQACQKLAHKYGVRIHTSQDVTNIVVRDGRVYAVQTKDKQYPADVVVGACDLPYLETQLLEKEHQSFPESYWKRKTLSISALMIYIGLDAPVHATHHSLYFGKSWTDNFEAIRAGVIPEDPSFYLSLRSQSDRTIVPKHGHELVVLVPLGSGGVYSESALKKLSDRVIAKVEKVTRSSIRSHVVVKKIYTPDDFANDFHAHDGAALGLAHTVMQSLWGRPSNKSSRVKNLYYAGQYTLPGVGLPMAVLSAQSVAKMIGPASDTAQDIFQRSSTTYYYSSVFFRGQVKEDVFSLYAYVRTIDNVVDCHDPDLEQLEQYWHETRAAWAGKSVPNRVVMDFIEVAQRKQFEWGWIEAFWSAMRADLKKKTYASYSELEEYMYGSAEVIGLMMAQILNLSKAARKTAQLQGKAMQLLNFIRDVKEDKQLGRKYLSYKESWRHDPTAWGAMMREYIAIYRKLQTAAEKGYPLLPKKYRIPIKNAADMYRWTADVIERDPLIVWRKKVKPSKVRVLYELLRNAVVS